MFDFRVRGGATFAMLLAGLWGSMLVGWGAKPAEPAVAETKKFRPVDESSSAGDELTRKQADAAGEMARAFPASGNAVPGSPSAGEPTPPGPTPKDGAISGEL